MNHYNMEMRHIILTISPLSNQLTHARSLLPLKYIVKNPHHEKCMMDKKPINSYNMHFICMVQPLRMKYKTLLKISCLQNNQQILSSSIVIQRIEELYRIWYDWFKIPSKYINNSFNETHCQANRTFSYGSVIPFKTLLSFDPSMLYDLALMYPTKSLKLKILLKCHLFVFSQKPLPYSQ